MNGTPYHRTAGKMVRRFYDDFDLLPYEMRQMLSNQERMPNFEDLKAAWELAGEMMDITDIRRFLYSFEEEVKAENKIAADKERERKRREKALERQRNRYDHRTSYDYRPVYRDKLMKRDDKHDRLVQIVVDEAAVNALTTRKENKDVVKANPAPFFIKRELIGYEKVPKNVEPEVVYQENLKETHIIKALHNG